MIEYKREEMEYKRVFKKQHKRYLIGMSWILENIFLNKLCEFIFIRIYAVK